MRVDELAVALHQRDALRARVLYARMLDADPALVERPQLTDPIELAIAASVMELIASRLRAKPPPWASAVAPLATPFVLVTVNLPEKLQRLRRESPPEFRARNLVAPEAFLLSANRTRCARRKSRSARLLAR